uniref:MalT-like TPR region domain-containing protein n=1 Tax=Pinguiococcus pyrenoidosus TaxID=172671 RepID=A0A7R9YC44_9STRA
MAASGWQRSFASVLVAASLCLPPTQQAWADGVSFATVDGRSATVEQVLQAKGGPKELSEDDIRGVQQAFLAFDAKQLKTAKALFSKGIEKWVELQRPRDEIVALIMARGNVLVDLKQFDAALTDYDSAIALMEPDGMITETGLARYKEFPNAFVQRGLAWEGKAKWDLAVEDYSKAIDMWGGGRGDGINPYVLTFRGNALTQLGEYGRAVKDYEAASDRFLSMRDKQNAAEARANLALALYEVGQTEEAVKIMKSLVRKAGMADERSVDLHVALASHYFQEGDRSSADQEFNLACYASKTGCSKFYDMDWVQRIRRWPPSLVAPLKGYLGRS